MKWLVHYIRFNASLPPSGYFMILFIAKLRRDYTLIINVNYLIAITKLTPLLVFADRLKGE